MKFGVIVVSEASQLTARDRMEKAYFELLETEHYSKISVSDIVSKAEISRTTFYRHYDDIFDMHNKVARHFATEIIKSCLDSISEFAELNRADLFIKVVECFNSQKKFINLISGKNGSRIFFEQAYSVAMEVLSSFAQYLPEEMLFRLKFITIACVGVYVKDILDNREHNPEYFDICKKVLDLKEVMKEMQL